VPERADPDEAPSSAGGGRPTVLYVMGAGRSGSTILGVALGNCENVLFAGELDRWLPKSGVPRDRPSAERVRFWSEVRGRMDDEAAELFGGRTTYLERSSALLDPRKWATRRRLRPRYRRVSEELYRALQRVTGIPNIVDTSHYPLRARELRALEGIDLHLLFLVRDPHHVVASLGREDVPERTFGVFTANAYLWLTYLISVLVFLRHPRDRRLFVRHEQFVADPAGVMSQILDSCCDRYSLPSDLSSLRTGTPFHGNRLVHSEVVALAASAAGPVHRAPLTTVLQLPWKLVFALLRPAVRVGAPSARSGAR
jgi:Sulfotransferase family